MSNSEIVPSTAQVLPEGERGWKPPGRVAAGVAALAIVVMAVAAIIAWVTGRDDSGEALFVLPVPGDEWQLSDGAVTEPEPDPDVPGTDERFISDGSLYGMADGNGFVGLRSIAFSPESPLPGAQWEPVETVVGDAYRRVGDSITFAVEQFEDDWLVVSAPSDLVDAYSMLTNDTSGLALVAVFDPPEHPETPTASFAMTAPTGSTFIVETAVGSPLFDAATFASRVDPVDIDGTAGWVVTAGSDDAETVVTWAPETGRTISVRSNAPRAEVVDAARHLQPVSADEWNATFPTTERD